MPVVGYVESSRHQLCVAPSLCPWRELEESVALARNPVVAFSVLVDAVDASERHPAVVSTNDRLFGAVGDDERAFLVAHEYDLVLRVVEHCPCLVLVVLYRTVVEELASVDGLLKDFKFLQSLAACRFPYHSFGQCQECSHGVGQVPWVVEIFHLVGSPVVVAESTVAHCQPHRSVHLADPHSGDVVFGHEHHLCEHLHVARLTVNPGDALFACGHPYRAVAVAEDGVDVLAQVGD